MHSVKKNIKYSIAMLIACIVALSFSCTMVFADTNGTEIKITDQPDRLIIQLGPEWIGVEFELKTDAGVFPAPVVVDDSGILRMDLGGSKTYTLSCLASSVSIPIPGADLLDPTMETTPSPTPSSTNTPTSTDDANSPGIPTLHIVLFGGGLAICVGGLIAMKVLKRRRETYYDDDEYDDE